MTTAAPYALSARGRNVDASGNVERRGDDPEMAAAFVANHQKGRRSRIANLPPTHFDGHGKELAASRGRP